LGSATRRVSQKPTEDEQRVALAKAHRARAVQIRASSLIDAALHRTGVLERAGLSRTTRQLEGIFGQKGIPDPTAMMLQIMKKRSVNDHEFMEQNALQPCDNSSSKNSAEARPSSAAPPATSPVATSAIDGRYSAPAPRLPVTCATGSASAGFG